jgi:propionate catabolism operon transcriptional regulator
VEIAEAFAASDLHILLIGETGTGKELFAQAIHRWSGRSGRLVDVNCGALPRELIEGELFGHRRGAFTGAIADRSGLLCAAAGGTLFLDEVTSLPLEAQVKLLRVLETGEVRPVGGVSARRVQLRAVAAAQPEIRQRLAAGTFRRDLYQRLAGAVIDLPPLSDRRDDIIPLAQSFARERGLTIAEDAGTLLLGRMWMGNIRELKSVIDRASLLSPTSLIDAHALAKAIALGGVTGPTSGAEESHPGVTAREALQTLCRDCAWRAEGIAAALGVSRATLFRLLRAHGLSLRRRQESRVVNGEPLFNRRQANATGVRSEQIGTGLGSGLREVSGAR